ncbi:MAG: DMT family transporter [Bacteroidaceae bacterium]|jgi:drug/metabolite transporter (DMT)-like permease|nr:DMT family transporter [Bacteroidaceae bacterium]
MKENNKAIALAMAAVLSWSTVATAFKIALTHLTHFEMLLVASITSLIIFALVLTIQRKWGEVKTLSRRMWGYFALLGLLNPMAYYLVLFKSYDLLPAQVAQPVNYIWPVLLVILLAVFTRQAIPAKKYIGMLVSLGGLIIISAGGKQIGDTAISASGLILGIMSAFLWATYWMVNNKNKDRADATVACFMSFLFGSIYLVAIAMVIGVNLNTLPGILSGMYVGAFEMGIPFICFGLAIRKTTNPALINQLCYLSPFLSLFFVSTILGEQIVPTTYIGLILIVAGIVFNEYMVKSKK